MDSCIVVLIKPELDAELVSWQSGVCKLHDGTSSCCYQHVDEKWGSVEARDAHGADSRTTIPRQASEQHEQHQPAG